MLPRFGIARDWSPPRGSSTLMTSAPRSASSRPPEGPATIWLSSRTRKPVSGRRPVPPVVAPSVICDISLQVVTTSVRPVARWLTVALDERQAESLGSSLPLFGPGPADSDARTPRARAALRLSWESRWADPPRVQYGRDTVRGAHLYSRASLTKNHRFPPMTLECLIHHNEPKLGNI